MQNQIELNQQFGIKDQLQFNQEVDGFVMVDISNEYAKARVSTYAGQVVSFIPNDADNDLLFLSDKAIYQDGKAIRGGTPICWPWFGDDTSGFGRPSHGFVRNQPWSVLASAELADGRTSVTLGLSDTEGSLAVWPYPFELELEVIVGHKLEVKLTTRNTGSKIFSLSQALHSYFNVSDVNNISISGLDGKNYLDKLDDFNSKRQSGDVTISEEIDRIYQQAPESVWLKDTGFDRTINIKSLGSNTTVIWNPWLTSVAKITDLDDSSYRNFICVETANAADDMVTIQPNNEHAITAIYEIV